MKTTVYNPAGKVLTRPSQYQKTHYPVRVLENKCDGKVVDGWCEKCGRDLARNGLHNPCRDGALGTTSIYADGSKIVTSPA
jgi:hypothetical protein